MKEGKLGEPGINTDSGELSRGKERERREERGSSSVFWLVTGFGGTIPRAATGQLGLPLNLEILEGCRNDQSILKVMGPPRVPSSIPRE